MLNFFLLKNLQVHSGFNSSTPTPGGARKNSELNMCFF